MRLITKISIVSLVMSCALAASATVITSITVNESYPAVVTFDSLHIYVNWQGLSFSTSDFVDITVNGGSGLTGTMGTVQYDFPCLGCLYFNSGGPYGFTIPATVYTESDPGFPFVQNTLSDSGVNIGYLWSATWSPGSFNGEVFTFAPEPGTLVLLGTGVLGLAAGIRRKLGM